MARFALFVLLSLAAFVSTAPAGAGAPKTDSLEPQNPIALCERFIKPTDQKDCEKKAGKMDLDWYASSVCGLMQDDHEVLACWEKIQKRTFTMDSLEKCRDVELSDSARLACLGGSGRAPASTGKSGAYQKLGK